MKRTENTHVYLHDKGLQMLNKDFESIEQHLSNTILLTDERLDAMRKKLTELNRFRGVFVANAKEPDRREWGSYLEKYEFIKNYGMRVTKTKFPLISIFSQHFYCTNEVGNYIRKRKSDVILDKLGTIKWMKKCVENIKKQGLTYNAFNMFVAHGYCAAEICSKNNYTINEEAIKELSYAAHYLEDMNETHHASNNPAIFSNHSKFEKYASKYKEKFIVESISDIASIPGLEASEVEYWNNYRYDRYLNNDYLQNRDGLDSFGTVCRWIGVISNLFASGVVDYETDARGERVEWALSSNKDDWEKNLAQTIPMAQLSVSLFLFTFVAYISMPSIFDFKR